MMVYNLEMLLISLGILFVLSAVWYFVYNGKINKIYKTSDSSSPKLLELIKPEQSSQKSELLCPAELGNTDDDIADALEYVEVSKFAKQLLESLYEQTGI